MTQSIPTHKDLIAPCGMDCGICSRYLAGMNDLKKNQCPGNLLS
ncbi:MAG: DUF3795 domain-containing protein [Desulfobacteraceae bacterium]|nr:MAG: DUF3795 domain-containing protein [Desulfobacteraceae bacterium]